MTSAALNRTEAADWCARVTGYKLTSATLRYWERVGLLRRQRPGNRVPARYGIADLIRLRVLAELRREGAPLQRVRRAVRRLNRLLPELLERPGSWKLAVTSKGEVVQIKTERQLLDLMRQPGQLVWSLFRLKDYAKAARAAIERAE